jgi:hypothetical protein
MDPTELHRETERAFNAGDIAALVGLYEPSARMVRADGSEAVGPGEVREVWENLLSLGGRIEKTTKYPVEAGAVALMSNSPTLKACETRRGGLTGGGNRRDGTGHEKGSIAGAVGGDAVGRRRVRDRRWEDHDWRRIW